MTNELITYPKMNELIKDILAMSDEQRDQYVLVRIEELEKELEIKTNFIEHQYVPLIKELTIENRQHKQALEKVRVMSKNSIIDKKYFDVADRALKGESE